MPFEHYQQQEQNRIRRLRRDLDGDNAEWIVEANSPFQLTPEDSNSNKGILLIHGLFDSPFTMRDLAKYYQALGFHVRCILLSGHGTIPEQLKDIEYQQWLEDVSLALSSFKKIVSNIYVAGFSTGGLLAMYHALIDPDIKGVIAVCPALNLKPMVALSTHILSWTKMMIERDYWNTKKTEQDPTKYSAFPMNAPHQVALLTEQFKKLNKYTEFTTPLFLAASEDDETISSHAAIHFFERQSNSKSRCIYYTNDIVDNEDMRITLQASRNVEQKILDYSHISLPISPENPHYGVNGNFIQPVHYHDRDNLLIFQGALTRRNLKKYNIRRLNYNPQFNALCDAMAAFLNSIAA